MREYQCCWQHLQDYRFAMNQHSNQKCKIWKCQLSSLSLPKTWLREMTLRTDGINQWLFPLPFTKHTRKPVRSLKITQWLQGSGGRSEKGLKLYPLGLPSPLLGGPRNTSGNSRVNLEDNMKTTDLRDEPSWALIGFISWVLRLSLATAPLSAHSIPSACCSPHPQHRQAQDFSKDS